MTETSSRPFIMYPFPCCRCGYCCTVEPCPPAKVITGKQRGICPFLTFDDRQATCQLIEAIAPVNRKRAMEIMGMGLGCCMAGWIMNLATKVKTWYSSLPDQMKHSIARANAKTQNCTERGKWASPFPELAHPEEEDPMDPYATKRT